MLYKKLTTCIVFRVFYAQFSRFIILHVSLGLDVILCTNAMSTSVDLCTFIKCPFLLLLLNNCVVVTTDF